MAFCAGAMATIRKIWNQITPELEKIIETVTEVTQKIKNLESDPTVEAILAIIPGASAVEGWINAGLAEITGITTEVEGLAAAITAWLNSLPTAQAKEAGIFKLASMSSKAADTTNSSKTDSFYDSAVQLHVMVNKDAA